jgi:hypothetical protein
MDAIAAGFVGIVFGLILSVAGALLSSVPVMLLWNAVIPEVLGPRPITWPQALWLCLLCALLFGTRSSVRHE